MTNGTRPYKTAYGHDMSCPYVTNHTLFDDQTTAVDKPEFAIKIGTLKIDGVKDADIDDKCIAFELTERIGQAGGGLDADSNYIVYVCYDKDNVYFACDAEDDVTLSSDVKLGVGLRDSAIHT